MKRILPIILAIICVLAGAVNAQTPDYYVPITSGTSNNYYPFGTTTGGPGSHVQLLYRPSDFQAPLKTGFIEKLYFMGRNGATSTTRTIDITVSIDNTSLTNLSGSSWVTGIPVHANISNYTYTITANAWCIELPLSTPFYYDGTSNIIIDLTLIAGTGNTEYIMTVSPPPSGGMVHRAYGVTGSASPVGADGAGGAMYRLGFDLFAGFPCTDTPKSKVAGPTQVCPNKPFTLKPDSFYANATYKWQYSNNGTSWSNFTGLPGLYADIIDSITSTKYYRCTITCDANKSLTYTTPVHKVTIAPFYYCYCDNYVVESAGTDIGNVTVINTQKGDTVINSGDYMPLYNNSKANRSYTPFHDSIAWPCLYKDTTYKFVITQINSASTFTASWVQAYLDVNRDGFYDYKTERLFSKALDGTGNPPEVFTANYKIPGNAEIGYTGLRIILSDDSLQETPCDSIKGDGEVEDYVVEICHRPCDGPVNAGVVVSTDTSMCADYEYVLTDSTYEKQRSLFTWNWEVSGDNKNWFQVNNSFKKDTLQRVFFGQPLYYRVQMVCSQTDDTTYSPATLVNIKPGYKCYCYSKATGGPGKDTSDIGGITIGSFNSNSGGPHLLNPKAFQQRTDYTDATPLEFFTDSVYSFYVFHTMPVNEHGDAKITVFMDFNNNHEYDIPEERVYTGFTSIGTHTLVDNIQVPLKAITDVPTGMRFILNNDVGPNVPSDSACGGYESGETEDFIVIFRKKGAQSIGSVEGLTGFGIHPNPSGGNFHVEFNTNANIEKADIRVTSMTGQVVYSNSFSHNGGTFDKEINIGEQPAGLYFVELQADGQRLVNKLIIQ